MNYYAQPEDELILNLFLDRDDFENLRAFLKEQQQLFERVSERGIALDNAIDPTLSYKH